MRCHLHLPITALLLFAGACAPPSSSDGTDQPPGGDGGDEGEGEAGEGEGEVGEGEGEVGEGEGEVGEGEGEGEEPITCTPGANLGPCSDGLGLCKRIGALTCNATGDGTSCTATAVAPTATDDANDNRFDDDCDGEIDEDFVAAPLSGAGPIHVRIRSTDGAPVSGAQVEITGDANVAGTTDESGDFAVDAVSFGSIHLEVTADDYAPVRYALVHAPSNAGALMEYVVKPIEVFSFSSEQGGVATVGSATVTLPAGGYVNKLTGDPVFGPLEVHVAYFDGSVEADMLASPPLYRTDEGPGSTLQTFGMIDVELFINGEPVQLGAGVQAQLDLPLAQYTDAFAIYRTIYPQSETIPAWFWNDVDGAWQREGDGQVVEVEGALRWQAAVTHFTRWNADAVYGEWGFDCYWQGCYTCDRLPSWMRSCGTDTGRCQSGQLACRDDGGHQVHLSDGGCTSSYYGTFCDARVCEGEVGPTGESCNGQDDDCDGRTDEGYGVGTSCSAGLGQCRSNGSIQCNGSGGASCNAVAGPATTETCNRLDDDCDGQTDEGLGLGNSCTVGVGACQSTGQLVCGVNGTVVCSVSAGSPSAETCNTVDDNCDGAVDNGIGKGDSCTVGVGACARTGTKICGAGGAVVCNVSPGAPALETCNGIDDNCDGTVDDSPRVSAGGGTITGSSTTVPGSITTVPRISGQAGDSCAIGSCTGTFQCTGGVGSCVDALTSAVYSDPAEADTCLNTTG